MELDTAKHEPVTREFLAVLLSGFGNELTPLTTTNGDEPSPKSLLAVANKPLLEYVLTWLEQSGIKDVLLICPAAHRASIYHHIHSDVSSSALRIDLQTVDESPENNLGTCALLRQFSNRIPEDFVVVPCDFIPPPSLPLSALLDKFRVDNLSRGYIATSCWYSTPPSEKSAFPEEWAPPIATTPIVWDSVSGTLLHIDTPDDADKNSDELELKTSLFTRYPKTKLSSHFQDSAVYVCHHSILKLLHQKPYFNSLREDFFPWLCKIQYQQTKQRKYGQIIGAPGNVSQWGSLEHSTLACPLTQFRDGSKKGTVPHSLVDADDEDNKASFGIGLLLHHHEAGPAIRVNNLHRFYEVNRKFLGGASWALPSDPKNRSLIDHKAQVSSDTIVGESTQISERVTIKRSVIGKHCIIGKMVKISGCVLLDHCVIEDGAKIDTCILGRNTKVGAKAELLRCVTQPGYEVGAGETVKGEKLEASDWTAALAEDDTEPSSTSDAED